MQLKQCETPWNNFRQPNLHRTSKTIYIYIYIYISTSKNWILWKTKQAQTKTTERTETTWIKAANLALPNTDENNLTTWTIQNNLKQHEQIKEHPNATSNNPKQPTATVQELASSWFACVHEFLRLVEQNERYKWHDGVQTWNRPSLSLFDRFRARKSPWSYPEPCPWWECGYLLLFAQWGVQQTDRVRVRLFQIRSVRDHYVPERDAEPHDRGCIRLPDSGTEGCGTHRVSERVAKSHDRCYVRLPDLVARGCGTHRIHERVEESHDSGCIRLPGSVTEGCGTHRVSERVAKSHDRCYVRLPDPVARRCGIHCVHERVAESYDRGCISLPDPIEAAHHWGNRDLHRSCMGFRRQWVCKTFKTVFQIPADFFSFRRGMVRRQNAQCRKQKPRFSVLAAAAAWSSSAWAQRNGVH